MILSNQCWMQDYCVRGESHSCPEGFCIKLFKIDSLYREALISEKQRKHVNLRIDADGTDREAFKILKSIEENIESFIGEGKNLYIHSSTYGCGKTSWALRMIESYINKIWYKADLGCKILFIHVPRFLISLKESISKPSEYIDHIKSNFLSADLVVFDELAAKTNTEYEMDQLLNLINSRLDEGRSNIYTSNLTDMELEDKVGGRLASRILGLSTNILLKGKDKRGIASI